MRVTRKSRKEREREEEVTEEFSINLSRAGDVQEGAVLAASLLNDITLSRIHTSLYNRR